MSRKTKDLACAGHNKRGGGKAVVEEEEDYYDVDARESGDVSYASDSHSQDQYGADQKSVAVESQMASDPYKDVPAKVMAAEANVQYETVEFIGEAYIPLKELLKNDSKGNKILSKENGEVVFSLKNGLLTLGRRTNGYDFIIPTDKKGAALAKDSRDIVKSVKLKEFRINYPGALLVSVNIPKFQCEEFFGDTQDVNCIFMKGELSQEKNNDVTILDRKITNSVMIFQNRFPNMSPEKFQADILKAKKGFALVSLRSPLITMINMEQKADPTSDCQVNGRYVKASIQQTEQILIPRALVKEYRPKTLDAMKKAISYASITNGDFQITLSVPLPQYRATLHKTYVDNKGQTGVPFLGFADPYQRQGKPLSANAKFDKNDLADVNEQFLEVSFKCVAEYLKITEEAIDLNL